MIPGIHSMALAGISKIVSGALVVGANTIAHGLGRTPVGWIKVSDNAPLIYAQVYRNAAWTVVNITSTSPAFDVETHDIGSVHSAGTFTAPVAGIYETMCCMGLAYPAGGGTAYIHNDDGSGPHVNGARFYWPLTANEFVHAGWARAFAAGETWIPKIYTSASGNSTGLTGVGSTWATFSLRRGLDVTAVDGTNLTVVSECARTASFLVW